MLFLDFQLTCQYFMSINHSSVTHLAMAYIILYLFCQIEQQYQTAINECQCHILIINHAHEKGLKISECIQMKV